MAGVLAGAAVGYGLRRRFPDRLAGRFRIEGEYFHRAAAYDQASGVSFEPGSSIAADEADVVLSEDHLGGVGGRHLFGNLYFDFPGAGRFVPYLGVGAGVGFTGVDYEALGWWRTDPARIGAGEGLPNAEAIRRRLAGTLIRQRTGLGDTRFGYQLLFGADYALTASLSLGVKGRLVDPGAFRDGGAWDVLRGYESQSAARRKRAGHVPDRVRRRPYPRRQPAHRAPLLNFSAREAARLMEYDSGRRRHALRAPEEGR